MDKPIKSMTDQELFDERNKWRYKITTATGWGAAVGAAQEFLKECDNEIRNRGGLKIPSLKAAISYLNQGTPEMETAEKFKMIYQEILDELQRALIQYPSFHSGHEGYALIKEELDELWAVVQLKQSTPGRSSQMYSEAKQVAAMAIRFMLDMPGFKN